jgi:hypothetical protein
MSSGKVHRSVVETSSGRGMRVVLAITQMARHQPVSVLSSFQLPTSFYAQIGITALSMGRRQSLREEAF